MPRYFFNIQNSEPDRDGFEFANDAAARSSALDMFGQMIRDIRAGAGYAGGYRLDVTDGGGKSVLALRFSAKGR